MFCKNCGSQVDPNAAICVRCGYQLGYGNNFCHNCGNPVAPGAAICTTCGYAQTPAAPVANGEQKSKLVATLLCFFLGGIGIHDFYLGNSKNGILKIVLTLCTGVGGGIWALIDFIRLLTGSIHTDANGVELKKEF